MAHRIQQRIRQVVATLVVIVGVAACSSPPARDTSAASLMPALPDYNVTEATDLQDALAKVGAAGALTTAQPEIAAAITGANAISQCYQRAGAYEARVYVNKAQPLNLGAVIIINRNVLTNPDVFTSCVAPQAMARSAVPVIQPCSNTFTLKTDTNEYYVGYVGSNPEVCAAFCNTIQGCVQ